MSPQAVGALLACATIVGCNAPGNVGVEVAHEASRVQRLTVPPNASLVVRPVPGRQPMLFAQEWTIATALGWADYAKLVTQALSPSYRCTALGDSRLGCSRSLPGDRLWLELRALRNDEGLRVDARFEARPD